LKKVGENRPQGSVAAKSTMVVGTKADITGAKMKGEEFFKQFASEFPVIFISAKNQSNLDALKKQIFQSLRVIRVYTKAPGRKQERDKPYLLPYGSTVFDAAKVIHNEFADSMTYARLWGSEKYEGQRVERYHIIKDRDTIEIHHK
jgi:ribosome-interacting GTPase 1